MKSLELCAKSIGHIAFETLSNTPTVSVIGTTSKGIFVRASRRVMFVSFEAYRSPLTITLLETADRLRAITTGSPAQILSGRLIFPDAGLAIAAPSTAVWHHPAPPNDARPVSERLVSLKRLAQEMLSNQARPGLGALLSPLLALPVIDPTPDDQKSLHADIVSLRQAMTHHDVPRAVELLSRFLGMGQGLTPSGDDFVIGLLLMLNRWPDAVWPGGDRRPLNRLVVQAAYDKTTTLSANLIECAACGQADERLVDVVDGILTGQPAESECASNLRRWGNSSGVDALVGMTVAAQV